MCRYTVFPHLTTNDMLWPSLYKFSSHRKNLMKAGQLPRSGLVQYSNQKECQKVHFLTLFNHSIPHILHESTLFHSTAFHTVNRIINLLIEQSQWIYAFDSKQLPPPIKAHTFPPEPATSGHISHRVPKAVHAFPPRWSCPSPAWWSGRHPLS